MFLAKSTYAVGGELKDNLNLSTVSTTGP